MQRVGSGIYVNGGVAWQGDYNVSDSLTDDKVSFDTGFRIDLGYQLGLTENWALQFEVGYIYNGLDKFEDNSGSSPAHGELWQLPVLANVIYNIPLQPNLNLYFGAGLGADFSFIHAEGDNADAVSFAYQGTVGLNYAVASNIDLGIAYKFLGTTGQTFNDLGGSGSDVKIDSSWNQSILLTVLFKF